MTGLRYAQSPSQLFPWPPLRISPEHEGPPDLHDFVPLSLDLVGTAAAAANYLIRWREQRPIPTARPWPSRDKLRTGGVRTFAGAIGGCSFQ
jgi:hypothetical protein